MVVSIHSLFQQQQQTTQIQTQHIQTIERPREQQIQATVQKCVINSEVQQVIPLVVSPPSEVTHHQQAFLVTPVQQLLPNGNLITPQSTNGHATTNTFSYQLTNAGYLINDNGNLLSTMSNGQHHAPYTFGRI